MALPGTKLHHRSAQRILERHMTLLCLLHHPTIFCYLFTVLLPCTNSTTSFLPLGAFCRYESASTSLHQLLAANSWPRGRPQLSIGNCYRNITAELGCNFVLHFTHNRARCNQSRWRWKQHFCSTRPPELTQTAHTRAFPFSANRKAC